MTLYDFGYIDAYAMNTYAIDRCAVNNVLPVRFANIYRSVIVYEIIVYVLRLL